MDTEEMLNAAELVIKYAVKSKKLEILIKAKEMKTLEEMIKYLEGNLEK